MLALCCLAALAAGGCDDNDEVPAEPQQPEIPVELPEPIGSYLFDGEEIDLLYGMAEESDTYYRFVFSPLDGSTALTTWFSFALAKTFAGTEVDVSRIYHNDDYIFIYEDPVRFYSYYRQLQGGTAYVAKEGVNYVVRLDIRLADGTPFALDFTGELPVAAEE